MVNLVNVAKTVISPNVFVVLNVIAKFRSFTQKV